MDRSSQSDNITTTNNEQQTLILDMYTNSTQTDSPITRKTQTLVLSGTDHRTQTTPINMVNVNVQSEFINSLENETMTDQPIAQDSTTNTLQPESRHCQTTIVKTDDKACGIEICSRNIPEKAHIPPGCRSKHSQTEKPVHVFTDPVDNHPPGKVWIQSATDFLIENARDLKARQETLDSIYHVCTKAKKHKHKTQEDSKIT